MDSLEARLQEFHNTGYTIVPAVLDNEFVVGLRSELCRAIEEDKKDYSGVFDAGMVHNLMMRGKLLAQVLENDTMNETVSSIMSDTHILYAYQSSSLPPGSSNYGGRVHVDSPRFIENYCTNVGVIFPLDDFTIENGATHVLPGSHKLEFVDRDVEDRYFRAVCKKGDMIVFHGRLWHRAGVNKTDGFRHAITLNMCRSYMRQRFDFPRMLSNALIDSLSEQGKRLIGMNVRVPVSLAEFYLPEGERLYKSNQG